MYYIYPSSESLYKDYIPFIEAHNEPVPDIGPYIQYKVMELASQYVTVTLDGQGADEQLAGYHNFFSIYFLELLRNNKFFDFLIENIYYLKTHRNLSFFKYMIYYILPLQGQQYISNKLNNSVSKSFINTIRENKDSLEINKMLYKPNSLNDALIQHFEYKLEHLLRWEDLNSMHFSIESRVPFLDHRLVEATIATPSSQKINKGNTKIILRDALNYLLPPKISNRSDKKGFSSPRDKWFRSEKFKLLIFDLLNDRNFKERGYFDTKLAHNRYKLHLEGKIDLSKELWKWINLEIWFNKYID